MCDVKTTNWKECLQRTLPTNIFASLVVRKIWKPNHISSFYEKFVYKRKALHLFRSINGFLQCTLRLGQSNFHLASVFPQNLMDRGSRKNWFVKKSRYRNRQDDVFEQLLHAAMTYIAPSVLGSQYRVSAALQRED